MSAGRPKARTAPRDAVVAAQDAGHGEGHDYDKGSPHLRHASLRSMVERRLTRMVRERIDATGSCRVLEIGAGHGTFTACLLAAGADVTVTEASSASADHLRSTFGATGRVEVIFDETGEGVLASERVWDLAVITSVLHHIPDYLAFLDRLCTLLAAGGGIFTVQDPLYYPRMSRLAHRAERAAYLSWRLFQGDYGRGVRTRLRRLRGVYDDSEPSDLVEYHVVRDGVDEEAIETLLAPRFASFELFRYWSSQAPLWQRVGDRTGLTTTFGLEATGHLE
jgi:protein-L-isoaspartate O-methyltransferase